MLLHQRFPQSLAFILLTLILSSLTATASERSDTLLSSARLVSAITGRVIDLDGNAVAGATVESPSGTVLSSADGRFTTAPEQGNVWITVRHSDFVSRTRAATPDRDLLVRLTDNSDGETVSLLFGGDTMMGRRFYDADENGSTDDGLIQKGNELETETALLKPIEPLLANADATIINLETPLTRGNSFYSALGPRPLEYHQEKLFAFSSHASTAAVLKEAGIDIMGLANNHIFDRMDSGVKESLEILDETGFKSGSGMFGAGLNEADAWSPAFLTIKAKRPGGRDTRIAVLGCTTITGSEHKLNYVASKTKGGAAACSLLEIRKQIAAARSQADAVIFMVHGGQEYERTPTEHARSFAVAAQKAGALLVINHHPHIVGGMSWDGKAQGNLTAWSMGNLLFDQTIWQTFESYVLIVHIRHDTLVNAYIEPLLNQNFVPHGVTSSLADYVAKGAAGRSSDESFVVENGSAVLDVGRRAKRRDNTVTWKTQTNEGEIIPIPKGWVSAFSPRTSKSRLRLGRDLLWTGSFEDQIVDLETKSGALWMFPGPDKRIGSKHRFAGKVGAGIWREPSDTLDVVLTTKHRVLIKPGTRVTLTGKARTTGTIQAQLSWYADSKGASTSQTLAEDIVAHDGTWQTFRVDAIVPDFPLKPILAGPEDEEIRPKPAVGIYLRLLPSNGQKVSADFDDIRLIEWSADDSPFSILYDHVLLFGEGDATLRETFLPRYKEN